MQSSSERDAAKARGDAPAQVALVEPDYLAIEADKPENLKQSLYAAFVAAPKASKPTALVDLAATYISALRLQMALRGYSAVPARSAKAPIFAAKQTR